MDNFVTYNQKQGKKVGLVLEGGAMRALYSAGVMDVFFEHGIVFDGIIGVSAGALFGINYLSNQPGRVIRYSKKYNGNRKYMGLESFLKTGNLVNTDFAYGTVQKELDVFDNETYIKNQEKTPFYAVVTNVGTGLPEYIQITDVNEQLDVLRASGSMPFVSNVVEINNNAYLDGAIADSIPYQKMFDLGYDALVVVLTKSYLYRKKPIPKVLVNSFYAHKFPALSPKIAARHEMYNRQLDKLLAMKNSDNISILRPSKKVSCSKMEKRPEKLEEVYNLGKHDAFMWLRRDF